MKWNYILWAAVFLMGVLSLFAVREGLFQRKDSIPSPSGALSLITEPDAGIAPVLAMISGAKTSLDLVMYELDDARVESALVADEARGVAVRVILSAGYDGTASGVPATINARAYDFLSAHGVPVRWSPAYFSLTHEKSLVVDGDRALVMTFNLVSKYYPTGRDFGIADGNARDVAAMEDAFDEDWKGSGDTASAAGDDLLWSPGAKLALIALVTGAKKSLSIYNEEMADIDVTKALIDAAQRGVAVDVVMTGADEWRREFSELTTAGVRVRTYPDGDDAPLYIHAKMIVVDAGNPDARAFVGSENFSEASLNENRELGIVTGDQAIITELMKTFAADWRGATPFAL
jgi:cardiolipin synthase